VWHNACQLHFMRFPDCRLVRFRAEVIPAGGKSMLTFHRQSLAGLFWIRLCVAHVGILIVITVLILAGVLAVHAEAADRAGKTHLATSLAMEACARGKKARFWRVTEPITTLMEAHEDRQRMPSSSNFSKSGVKEGKIGTSSPFIFFFAHNLASDFEYSMAVSPP
jgi:hypothetical protein